MEKRKLKNQDSTVETKKKKHKKSKDHTDDADGKVLEHNKMNSVETRISKTPKHMGNVSVKKGKEQKKKDESGSKAFSVQNLLTEKLKNVQRIRSGNADEAKTDKVEETRDKMDRVKDQVDRVSDLNKSDSNDLHNEKGDKVKKKSDKKKKGKTETGNVTDTAEQNMVDSALKDNHEEEEEEEDPEKAAIREKKREKRKQKKLEKAKLKQENADRAGTAQTAATDYLKQWKNNRDEWKFLKVRQVWLLQNMYDKTVIEDGSFEILLEYLEGLRGKSREVTVSEAEKVLEKAESDEESSSVKFDRARQIIQLLSD
ncbi:uncharacterized protein C7orf50 homolog [Mercenaria mercenaria]|uniref:uncharacterized protein C7orf50 homolog n=1 Tax=Mercenaria mercenaria TaxID=6596 RepID=UPI00234F2827|nr:uncharacterized protein C7orf50 homolog [Mercenaria mercenaria]